MNRYLEKIAKEYLVRTEEDNPDVGNKIGTGIGTAVVAGAVNKKISPLLQNPIMKYLNNKDGQIPHEVLEKMKADVLPRTNTTMRLSEVGGTPAFRNMINLMGAGSPFYADKEGLVTSQKRMHFLSKATKPLAKLVKAIGFDVPVYDNEFKTGSKPFTKNYLHFDHHNTDVIAHELGHAVDMNTGPAKFKKALYSAGARLSGLPSAAIGGAMLTNEKTRDYAWMAPVVASMPTLHSEAMANKHAYNLIKKHGGNPKKFLGLAAANMLGYAAKPLLTGGTIAGINHLRRKGEEINPEEYLRDRA